MNVRRLRRVTIAVSGFAATLSLLALVPAWASSPAAADASEEPPAIQEMHAACSSGDTEGMFGTMGSLGPEDLAWMDGHLGDDEHGPTGAMAPHDFGTMGGHMGGAYQGAGAHGMTGAQHGGASGWTPEPALWW